MKTYTIPIIYQSVMTFDIEAENLQEAVNEALKKFLAIPDENYLNDSFQIDDCVDDDYSDEEYDINKSIQNL